MAFMSTTLFKFPLTPGTLQTSAFIFLSLKTVPIPPRPACFRRTNLRFTSKKLKLSIPISEWSAALPAETTAIFFLSLSLSAYISVSCSARTWLSMASSGASIISTLPLTPSIKIIISFSAFPWSSRASKPENFKNGPKYPPTLLSIIESVRGEILTTNDFPAPEY